MEKTRITHVRDGFDFLGFHLELEIGQQGKFIPKTKVPRRAISRAVRRLNEAMRFRPHQESGAARIVRGSADIRGWSNDFKIAQNYSQSANLLDHHEKCYVCEIRHNRCLVHRSYGFHLND